MKAVSQYFVGRKSSMILLSGGSDLLVAKGHLTKRLAIGVVKS
jgi:hypothetical protein